jgi:hypothetical protein
LRSRSFATLHDLSALFAHSDMKQKFREQTSAAPTAFLASDRRIALPTCGQPDVSIVRVLFNQAELTFECRGSGGRDRDRTCDPYRVEVTVIAGIGGDGWRRPFEIQEIWGI